MVPEDCLKSTFVAATDQEPYTTIPERFLQEDFQNLTSILACTAAAAVCQGDETPSGLTSRFEIAFTQPTPGKLNEFVNWCSQRLSEERAPALSTALVEQTKGGSWLKTVATLRNLWAHPKDEPRDAILERVQEALQNPPDFIAQPRIEITVHAAVQWVEQETVIPLAPFVVSGSDRVSYVVELESGNRWRFRGEPGGASERFARAWFDHRVRDNQLHDPSAEEVLAKARKTGQHLNRDQAWWVSGFLSQSPPGILTESIPHLPTGSREADDSRGALAVELRLDPGAGVNETIAAKLGLADPPTTQDLVEWSRVDGGFVLLTKTENLGPRDVLQLLYWLADIRDRGTTDSLKLVMSRSHGKLTSDQEKLWDRLPDDLESLLAAPPRSKRSTLEDYLWPSEKPRRLFGLF